MKKINSFYIICITVFFIVLSINIKVLASTIVNVTSMSLNKTSDVLTVGETDVLIPIILPTTSINQTVTWVSSNPSIVYVFNGTVMAVAKGTAVITATTSDGYKSAYCTVTVDSPSIMVSLNKTSDVLPMNTNDTLIATVNEIFAYQTTVIDKTVVWATSDPKIAQVINGTVYANGIGNAVITATTDGGSNIASCYVAVTDYNSVISLELSKNVDSLTMGTTDTLTALITPITSLNKVVIWTTSNPNIVKVVNGILTPVSVGSATITATFADESKFATCIVNVNSASQSDIKTARLGGQDRYETSVTISQEGWKGTANDAVLASGYDFPDGLSSAPLAKKYNAPILLTYKDSIPSNVLAEIKRLKVTNIFITGGTGVVSLAIENQLNAMGIKTERFGGKDRYETSIKIAEKLGITNGEIIVANGTEWADALSASSIAAIKGIPIILTYKEVLPDLVSTFLRKNNVTKTYILGDTDLIGTDVANSLPGQERIAGITEYDRNVNILERFQSDIDLKNICIASGRNFADAISGSALAAASSSGILLVDDTNLNDITTAYVTGKMNQIKNINIFGLQGAVNDDVIQKLFNRKDSMN